MNRVRRRRTSTIALAAFVVLASGLAARAATCEGTKGFATVAFSVTKDAAGKTVLSLPPDVMIYKDPAPDQNGRVCFVVRDLGRSQSVAIAAKPVDEQDGGTEWTNPFPKMVPLLARRDGRTFFSSPPPVATGRWKYGLTLTKGDETIHTIDPVIIVEPGGGSNIGPGGGTTTP